MSMPPEGRRTKEADAHEPKGGGLGRWELGGAVGGGAGGKRMGADGQMPGERSEGVGESGQRLAWHDLRGGGEQQVDERVGRITEAYRVTGVVQPEGACGSLQCVRDRGGVAASEDHEQPTGGNARARRKEVPGTHAIREGPASQCEG